MNESICKCGRKIVWGVTEEGKRIPLDPVASTYQLEPFSRSTIYKVKRSEAMVSHFATCKFANEYSKKHKNFKDGQKQNQLQGGEND